MQHARGFIVGCANRVTLISWEAEHTEQQIRQAFYMQKTILSAYYIRVTKWLVTRLQSTPIGTNFAGYMFTKQSYWHKLRGLLFKLKAILLVQTARAFVQLRRPLAFQLSLGLFTGCILIGWLQVTRWGGESHHFTGNRNPSPGHLPAPAPAAPRNKTYFSASKTNKKNISDTWIIDTGKRETRYQLVKMHLTVRQPHIPSFFFVISFNLKIRVLVVLTFDIAEWVLMSELLTVYSLWTVTSGLECMVQR